MPVLSPLQQDTSLPAVTLILGGVRSGKSSFAENLVRTASQGRASYVATADAAEPPSPEPMFKSRFWDSEHFKSL